MHIEGNIVIYNDVNGGDEARFLQWFGAHAAIQDEILHAYIANVPRRPGTNSSDPVRIHTSPFPRLGGHRNYTNHDFYKVCSTDYDALYAWLAHHGYLDVHDTR